MSTAPNIPVLMYHHVSPSPGSLTTSPENFERQIAWLAKSGWKTLGADEFSHYLAHGDAPRKSIVLTFDDGYLDNWVYAHPVLERHGMKALMFLVSGWPHDLPMRPHAGQSGLRDALPVTPNHKDCKALLLEGKTDAVIARWSEIRAMQDAGTFEIHSHTHTHNRWDKLCATAADKRQQLTQDLDMARQTLSQRLGHVSEHLCWPQGYFDDDYREVARAAGFSHFYTTDAHGQNKPGQDAGYIYRLSVKNRAALQFAQRILLARSPLLGPLYNRWKKGAHKKA